jgi:hypothetical protein
MIERRSIRPSDPTMPGGTIGNRGPKERRDPPGAAGDPAYRGVYTGAGDPSVNDLRPVTRKLSGTAYPETDGVDDIRTFIGHTFWKSAPAAHIEVDEKTDLLTVSCYSGFPDVEIDPTLALSVGFHRYGEEYLLTSLCLYGVARWSEPPTARTAQATNVMLARALLGGSVSGAVADLLGGGSGTVELSTGEAGDLTLAWHRFVSGNT